MKLSNGEIRLMKEPLEELNKLRLPAKVSFRVAKLSNQVEENFKAVEQVRVKLVIDHGVVGEDGSVQITNAPPEEQEKFWKEFIDLMSEEVEIEVEPIVLPEDLEVEPGVLKPLMRVVEVA